MLLIETRGPFMLVDPYTQAVIPANRPSVVPFSPFLESRVACGQVKVFAADLADDKTDAEFLAYWVENREIAVEAFLSEPEPEAAPPAKTKGKGK